MVHDTWLNEAVLALFQQHAPVFPAVRMHYASIARALRKHYAGIPHQARMVHDTCMTEALCALFQQHAPDGVHGLGR
jgi:hypothetical protein